MSPRLAPGEPVAKRPRNEFSEPVQSVTPLIANNVPISSLFNVCRWLSPKELRTLLRCPPSKVFHRQLIEVIYCPEFDNLYRGQHIEKFFPILHSRVDEKRIFVKDLDLLEQYSNDSRCSIVVVPSELSLSYVRDMILPMNVVKSSPNTVLYIPEQIIVPSVMSGIKWSNVDLRSVCAQELSPELEQSFLELILRSAKIIEKVHFKSVPGSKIRKLHLKLAPLSDSSANRITMSDLSNLEELEIKMAKSANFDSDLVLSKMLRSLTNLRTLSIRPVEAFSPNSYHVFESIAQNCSKLESLVLRQFNGRYNRITMLTSESMVHLNKLKNLKYIFAPASKITCHDFIELLRACPKLHEVEISDPEDCFSIPGNFASQLDSVTRVRWDTNFYFNLRGALASVEFDEESIRMLTCNVVVDFAPPLAECIWKPEVNTEPWPG